MQFIVTAEEAENFLLPTDVEPNMSVNTNSSCKLRVFENSFSDGQPPQNEATAVFSVVFGSLL